MFFAVLLSLGLLLTATIMMRAHRRTWSALQQEEVGPERRQFGQRQFRRRMTASALMGFIGLLVLVSPAVTDPHLTWYWLYWGGMLVLVFGLCSLAFLDALDTLRYFRAVRSSLLAKHAADAGRSDDLPPTGTY